MAQADAGLAATEGAPPRPLLLDLGLIGLVAASFGHLPDVARSQGLPVPWTALTLALLVSVVVVGVVRGRRAVPGDGRWSSAARRYDHLHQGVALATAPLLAYGLTIALGLLHAHDQGRAVDAVKGFVLAALLLVTTVLLVTTRRALFVAAWTVVVTAATLCAVNLGQHLTARFDTTFLGLARPVAEPGSVGDAIMRIGGPFEDPNYFAQRLVVAVPIAVWLSVVSRSWAHRLAAAGTGAICAATIFGTGSRGGLVALVAVMAISIRGLVPARRRAWVWPVLLVVLPVLLTSERTRDRVAAVPDVAVSMFQADEAVGRAREWRVAVAMFSDHPFVGVGAGNFPARYLEYAEATGADLRRQERTAHNLILESLAETGLIGLAAFSALFAVAFESFRRTRARLGESPAWPGLVGAFRASLVGYLVAGMFLGLVYDDLLWVLLGVAFGSSQLTAGAAPAPGVCAAGDEVAWEAR